MSKWNMQVSTLKNWVVYHLTSPVYVFSKSTWGEQPVGDILHFTCTIVFVCLCHASWPNEKRYRPKIWYTCSPRPHLKTVFLFFWTRYLTCLVGCWICLISVFWVIWYLRALYKRIYLISYVILYKQGLVWWVVKFV